MHDTEELKRRQAASQIVEKKVIDMLLGFTSAEDLKVRDIMFIARFARTVSFDAFDPNRKDS